jgi:hypothetical protein
MVHCTKCGHENPDDSKFCASCGNALYPAVEPGQARSDGYARRGMERDMCFGVRGGFWPLLIGFAILLWGISLFVETTYGISFPWWPIVVIIIGLLIVVQAIRRRI